MPDLLRHPAYDEKCGFWLVGRNDKDDASPKARTFCSLWFVVFGFLFTVFYAIFSRMISKKASISKGFITNFRTPIISASVLARLSS